MKTLYEKWEETGAEERKQQFMRLRKLPYDEKVRYAEEVAYAFLEAPEVAGKAYVSVGGLDSITLLVFLRNIGIDVPAVSRSGLEDRSIQKIHKQLGVEPLYSEKTKVEVLKEFGWPVLSKETAGKIETLQRPNERNKTTRHAIITGETGAYGGYRKSSRSKLANKWLKLFAGYENENEGTNYQIAPFLVSQKCCYYLKEKPCYDYARQTGRYPYMGMMASEGGRRSSALMLNGCNYITKGTKRSCPFAIFDRQDILQLAIDLDVPVPSIYGQIVRDSNGALRTTLAQRTGCSMCGFGITLEKRPHRFDLLWGKNQEEWEFWMTRVMQDKDGNWYGWGRILDYIGVEWRNPEQYKS